MNCEMASRITSEAGHQIKPSIKQDVMCTSIHNGRYFGFYLNSGCRVVGGTITLSTYQQQTDEWLLQTVIRPSQSDIPSAVAPFGTCNAVSGR